MRGSGGCIVWVGMVSVVRGFWTSWGLGKASFWLIRLLDFSGLFAVLLASLADCALLDTYSLLEDSVASLPWVLNLPT